MTPLEISTSRVQDLLRHADLTLPHDSPFALHCTSLWQLSELFVTEARADTGPLPDDPLDCVSLASKETVTWDLSRLDPMAGEFMVSLAHLVLDMRQAATQ